MRVTYLGPETAREIPDIGICARGCHLDVSDEVGEFLIATGEWAKVAPPEEGGRPKGRKFGARSADGGE